jgi:hypothetical protein
MASNCLGKIFLFAIGLFSLVLLSLHIRSVIDYGQCYMSLQLFNVPSSTWAVSLATEVLTGLTIAECDHWQSAPAQTGISTPAVAVEAVF